MDYSRLSKGLTYYNMPYQSAQHAIILSTNYYHIRLIHWIDYDEFEPRKEVKEWLNENTPTWSLVRRPNFLGFGFKDKDHAMLFKMIWG